MREIKFRFWNKISRKFEHSKNCAIMGSGRILNYDYDTFSWPDDGEDFENTCVIAQQFTGLKDINEKLVYEGDIIQFINNNEIFEIKFGDYEDSDGDLNLGFYTQNIQLEWKYKCGFGSNSKLKIIGNIFQNPKLLK